MNRLLLLLSVMMLSACAGEVGKPWGYWMPKLWLSWANDDGRWVDEQLKTANGYLLTQPMITFKATQISLFYSDINTSSKGFDPSSPPAGCTLCHNDHCHCGDRLVPYSELAGSASANTSNELYQSIDQSFSFLISNQGLTRIDQDQEGESLNLKPLLLYDAHCDQERCALDRSRVTAIQLKISSFQISAIVEKQINQQREYVDTQAISIELPIDLTFSMPIDEVIDEDAYFQLPISVIWQLNAKIVDIFEWEAIKQGLSNEEKQILIESFKEQLILKTKTDIILKTHLD